MFDSHAHLNFLAFKNDVDEVISRSLVNNCQMVNVGSNYQTSRQAVELAAKHPHGVYASVGLHPIHLAKGVFKMKLDPEEEAADNESDVSFADYEKLAGSSKKVVAIGEIGLDFYYKPKTRTKMEEFRKNQYQALESQLAIAEKLNLPVIFHCRSAHRELIEFLRVKNQSRAIKGVVHCFTGSWQEAKQYLELGLYLGFNGIIFKLDLEETIKNIPLEKMLVETDCPYLTPPDLGKGRNEPLNVSYIIKRIAELRKTSYQEIETITSKNAEVFFSI